MQVMRAVEDLKAPRAERDGERRRAAGCAQASNVGGLHVPAYRSPQSKAKQASKSKLADTCGEESNSSRNGSVEVVLPGTSA